MYRLLLALCLALPVTLPAAPQPDLLAALTDRDSLLIDVRSAEEFAAGALPGAIRIGHEQIGEQIASIAPDKQQQIVLYCRSGRRSQLAEQRLRELGYRNLINAGGYAELKHTLQRSPACSAC
jgi:phage shock protein E